MKKRNVGRSPLIIVALAVITAAVLFMFVRVQTDALPPRDEPSSGGEPAYDEPATSDAAAGDELLQSAQNKVAEFSSALTAADDPAPSTLIITQEELTALLGEGMDGLPVNAPFVTLQGDGVCVITGTADLVALREQASGAGDPILPTVLALLPDEVPLRVTAQISLAQGALAANLLEVEAAGVTLPVAFFQESLAPAVDSALSAALSGGGISLEEFAITEGMLTVTGRSSSQ